MVIKIFLRYTIFKYDLRYTGYSSAIENTPSGTHNKYKLMSSENKNKNVFYF